MIICGARTVQYSTCQYLEKRRVDSRRILSPAVQICIPSPKGRTVAPERNEDGPKTARSCKSVQSFGTGRLVLQTIFGLAQSRSSNRPLESVGKPKVADPKLEVLYSKHGTVSWHRTSSSLERCPPAILPSSVCTVSIDSISST
jgi:hypothetical protein